MSGPVGFSNYSWSTNQHTQSIEVDTTGTYILFASGGTCNGYDTITVRQYVTPLIDVYKRLFSELIY